MAAMQAHFSERIHFDQAMTNKGGSSNNGLRMLNPEYPVLAQEKHLHCRLERCLLL